MYSYAVDETPFPSRVAPKMNPRENQCCVIARRGLKNGRNKGADIVIHARSFDWRISGISVFCLPEGVGGVPSFRLFEKQHRPHEITTDKSLPDALEAVCSYDYES